MLPQDDPDQRGLDALLRVLPTVARSFATGTWSMQEARHAFEILESGMAWAPTRLRAHLLAGAPSAYQGAGIEVLTRIAQGRAVPVGSLYG